MPLNPRFPKPPPPGGPTGFTTGTYTNRSNKPDVAPFFAFPSQMAEPSVTAPGMVPLHPVTVTQQDPSKIYSLASGSPQVQTNYGNQIHSWATPSSTYACSNSAGTLDGQRSFMIWVWNPAQTPQPAWLCFSWIATATSQPGESIKEITAVHNATGNMDITVIATNGQPLAGSSSVAPVVWTNQDWLAPPWGGEDFAGTFANPVPPG